MHSPVDPFTVRLSTRVYRRLLLAYPTTHRETFGADMGQVFRDQCRAAWQRNGGFGMALLWGATLADLLVSATWEHFANLQSKISMLQTLAKFFRMGAPAGRVFRVTFLITLFLLLTIGTVVTLIMPKSFASTARILVVRQDDKAAEYNPYLIQEVMQRMRTDEVLDQVATDLDLNRIFGARYGLGQSLTPAQSRIMLASRFEFRPVRGASLIEVRAYSEQPQEAAQLANTLVADFLRQVQQSRQASAARPATVSSAFNEAAFKLISNAEASSRPVRPNVPANVVVSLLIGGAVGWLLGVLVAGLVRWQMQRPHRPVTSH